MPAITSNLCSLWMSFFKHALTTSRVLLAKQRLQFIVAQALNTFVNYRAYGRITCLNYSGITNGSPTWNCSLEELLPRIIVGWITKNYSFLCHEIRHFDTLDCSNQQQRRILESLEQNFYAFLFFMMAAATAKCCTSFICTTLARASSSSCAWQRSDRLMWCW